MDGAPGRPTLVQQSNNPKLLDVIKQTTVIIIDR